MLLGQAWAARAGSVAAEVAGPRVEQGGKALRAARRDGGGGRPIPGGGGPGYCFGKKREKIGLGLLDTMLGGENGCSIDSKRRLQLYSLLGDESLPTQGSTTLYTCSPKGPNTRNL
jgi:hypothetical protein